MSSKTSHAGKVVVITAKSNPHYGEEAVIQYQSLSGRSYYVRALHKRPTIERFMFDKHGRIRGTRAPEERYIVRTTSVRFTKKRAPTLVNKWQKETGQLLRDNISLTKKQIMAKYG